MPTPLFVLAGAVYGVARRPSAVSVFDVNRTRSFGYVTSVTLVLVHGDYGLLEWRAETDDGSRVCDGADSYGVNDGKIPAQTIQLRPALMVYASRP